MSNIHEPQIVNIVGHSAGAIIFGIFVYLLLRDRSGTRLRGSWLSVVAGVLAFLWNAGSLAVLVASTSNFGDPRLLVFISFSALSLLPAILLHLSLAGTFRFAIAIGYVLALIAICMHFGELLRPGRLYQEHALLLITVGFAILTVASVIGIAFQERDGGRAKASRMFGAMCSALLAMSFVHFGSGHPAQAWSSELVFHHAGIPLALFVLMQDYRFALLDAFIRFLANVLIAAMLAFAAVRISTRWILVDGSLYSSPLGEALLFLCLCMLLIGFVPVRGQIQRLLTSVLFRRPDLDRMLHKVDSRAALFNGEDEFLTWAAEHVARYADTDRALMYSEKHPGEIAYLSTLVFPSLASDVPSLRHLPEFAWVDAIVPLRLGHADVRYLFLGRRKGGRRYLSEDLQGLSRLAAAVSDQVVHFRNSEMRRLVSQAELRALQSQINPHFLFNALNTLYGIIPREAEGARKTVLNLAEIFRYSLQSERTLIRLSYELEIVRAYLDIERLRLGPRLETVFEIEEGALPVFIPILSIQPLVENAIKHGVAAKAGQGLLSITAKVRDKKALIMVQDTGPGISPQLPNADRSHNGVGLANVKRRLELCFGPEASLIIDSSPAGTRVQFSVPLTWTESGVSLSRTRAQHSNADISTSVDTARNIVL